MTARQAAAEFDAKPTNFGRRPDPKLTDICGDEYKIFKLAYILNFMTKSTSYPHLATLLDLDKDTVKKLHDKMLEITATLRP